MTIGTIFLSLLVLFYLLIKYKHNYWARRGIYSPPVHWFFGHFRDAILLRTSPTALLRNLHLSYKDQPIIGFYIMHKPFLLIRSVEIAKNILIKDFNIFSQRQFSNNRTTDPVVSQNLFSIEGTKWKYLRKKFSNTVTTNKLKKYVELMLEKSDNMKDFLTKKISTKDQVTLDIRDISSRYTADVASSFSYGINTNSFVPKDFDFFERCRSPLLLNLSNVFLSFINFFFPKLADILHLSFLGNNTQYLRNLFWYSMNEREKLGIKRGDIIDSLLDIKHENHKSEHQFEGDYLLAHSATFFLAGHETSAITISYSLVQLAKNPEIQKKSREEIGIKIGNEKITYENVLELHYLQQIVSETLRIYPPSPLIDRIALEDYRIPGTDIRIEKGTAVFISLNGLHIDPKYYQNPDKFDPDRFSNTRKNEIEFCAYMPFGEGPRSCLGMRFGTLQILICLATILREYEVIDNPKFDNKISARSIFTAPNDGVFIDIKKV